MNNKLFLSLLLLIIKGIYNAPVSSLKGLEKKIVDQVICHDMIHEFPSHCA